jgi:hypothetical protein
MSASHIKILVRPFLAGGKLRASGTNESADEPQANDRGGKAKEGLLNVREPVESAAKAAKCVQPGIGSLDEPTCDAQAAAVFGVAGREDGGDSQPTEKVAQRSRVIGTVALKSIRELPVRAWLAADGGHARQDMHDLGHLVDIGRGKGDVERDSVRIGQDVMFAAGFAAIRRVGAGFFASFGCLGEGRIDQGSFPIDLIGAVEFGQQHGVQFQPHARFVPESQMSPTGFAAAPAKFRGQVLPGDAGFEDEENAGEDLAPLQRLAAGEAKASLGGRWQQGFDPVPKFVGDERLHGSLRAIGFGHSRCCTSCARAN